ncbi:cytochrome c family protein [Pseudomonas cavernicola]|uniref:Cytochrome c family protein n=2 Tax=Pseudomonas cavernicola TaxID=2320866 RepID=A0A418XPN5_9PSED|nr:cytochrome c family protein [Pseudomonas cavernicola]
MFIATTNLHIGPSTAQDAVSGGGVFKQRCATCHSINPDKPSTMGPNLAGILGRKAGTVPGFAYSNAIRNSEIVWSSADLDIFIKSPQKFVKGTKMFAPGISDARVRANLITYLETLK